MNGQRHKFLDFESSFNELMLGSFFFLYYFMAAVLSQ